MVTYPVHVRRNHYSGSKEGLRLKAARDNRIAGELEEYINKAIEEQNEEEKIYLYSEIAHETGYSLDVVHRFLFSVDGGSNGFTVVKKSMDNLER